MECNSARRLGEGEGGSKVLFGAAFSPDLRVQSSDEQRSGVGVGRRIGHYLCDKDGK